MATYYYLLWNASTDTGGSGLKEYIIYKNGVEQGRRTNLVFPISTDVTPVGCWSVKAEDNVGNISGALTCISYGDTTPPTKVVGLAVTTDLGDQITLIWTAATDNVGVTHYEWNTSDDGIVWDLGGLVASTSAFIPTEPETLYYLRVRAFDAAGNAGLYSSTITHTTSN